jgi:hypothetical protein
MEFVTQAWIWQIVLILPVVFLKTTMRLVGLEPERAGHLFAALAAGSIWALVLVFFEPALAAQAVLPFLAGLVLGIPTGRLSSRRVLRKIRGDSLHLYPDTGTVLACVVGLAAGLWAARHDHVAEFMALMWGVCLSSSSLLAYDVIRYEQQRGPLWIRHGRNCGAERKAALDAQEDARQWAWALAFE